MTTRTAKTSPLVHARGAGLRAPQVIKTRCRYVTLSIFIHKGDDQMMVDVKIILSALWVASMFVWQQGDVQRLYSGDFVPGETKLGEVMSPEMLWMISAITMTIPVVMIILSLTLPHNVNRWANIIIGIFYTGYNLIGLPGYPSAYDKFLIIVGLVFNVLTVWYAWKWV
jgi:hypothetical protein